MSEPPVGKAALFAEMLGSKRESNRKLVETLTAAPVAEGDDQHQGAADDAVDDAEQSRVGDATTSSDIEAERREVAALLLGDPRMAKLVTGDTVAEIVKNAAEVAQTLREGRAEAEAKRVDFDGGVRESVPPPPPTHEEFLSSIFDNMRQGGGSGW